MTSLSGGGLWAVWERSAAALGSTDSLQPLIKNIKWLLKHDLRFLEDRAQLFVLHLQSERHPSGSFSSLWLVKKEPHVAWTAPTELCVQSLPCAAESLLSLRHLAASAWQGTVCVPSQRGSSHRQRSESVFLVPGSKNLEGPRGRDKFSLTFQSPGVMFVIHKVHTLVSCTGSSAGP